MSWLDATQSSVSDKITMFTLLFLLLECLNWSWVMLRRAAVWSWTVGRPVCLFMLLVLKVLPLCKQTVGTQAHLGSVLTIPSSGALVAHLGDCVTEQRSFHNRSVTRPWSPFRAVKTKLKWQFTHKLDLHNTTLQIGYVIMRGVTIFPLHYETNVVVQISLWWAAIV